LSIWKNGITDWPSVEFVPARPKYRVSPVWPDRHGLEPEGRGAVLLLRERQRVDHLEPDLAPDFAAISSVSSRTRLAYVRSAGMFCVAWSEKNRYRLIGSGTAASTFFGPFRERVEAVLGEVQARAAQERVAEHDRGQEHQRQHGQRAAGERATGELSGVGAHVSAFLRSITTAVA
jgi:hypothetical protein